MTSLYKSVAVQDLHGSTLKTFKVGDLYEDSLGDILTSLKFVFPIWISFNGHAKRANDDRDLMDILRWIFEENESLTDKIYDVDIWDKENPTRRDNHV